MANKPKKNSLELVDVDNIVDYTDILNSLESLKAQVNMVINQVKTKKRIIRKK